MTKKIKIFGVIALAIALVLGGMSFLRTGHLFGSTSYDISYLVGDVYQGMSNVLMFTGGVFVGPANTTSLKVNSGTAITGRSCNTVSWNPPAVGPYVAATSSTSTDILLTGAVLGDLCSASLTSATSSAADISCNVSATGTSTISLYNTGTIALDLATGTAKVCYTH